MATNTLKTFRQYLSESSSHEEYAGEHQAPGAEDTAPLHDLTANYIYPDDIYGSEARRHYCHNNEPGIDMESLSIIWACHNRPNKAVKIYRAIPDVNYEVDRELKTLRALFKYKQQYGFFPMSSKSAHIRDLTQLHSIEEMSYDEQQANIVRDLERKIEELSAQRQPLWKINSGDWVSCSRAYAKQHGEHHLNGQYKIISKVVFARQVFTDGNDINEWGYVAD